MAVRHTEPGKRLLPRRKTALRESKWPWEQVSKAYIEGIQRDPKDPLALDWPTLDKVAELFGIPDGTVKARATREHWVAQREDFQRRVALTRRNKRVRELANKSEQFDTTLLNAAQLGSQIVVRRLAQIARNEADREQQAKDQQARMQRGELLDLDEVVINGSVTGVDSKELLDLANSAEKFDVMVRRIFGAIDPSILDEPARDSLDSEDENMGVAARMAKADPERIAKAISTLQSIGLLEEIVDAAMDNEPDASDNHPLELEAGTSDADAQAIVDVLIPQARATPRRAETAKKESPTAAEDDAFMAAVETAVDATPVFDDFRQT